MAETQPSGRNRGADPKRKPANTEWMATFLAELAATSNVSAAAREAGIHTSAAYDARRTDAEFYRKWREALCEGYDHLEMTLLYRLRTGELKGSAGSAKRTRTFDNATAFRLLQAHREAAAQERAVRDNEDADAVLASINAKLDLMRERALKTAEKDADGAG